MNSIPDQVKSAADHVFYVLNRIKNDPELAWFFVATESLERLIDAAAILSGKAGSDLDSEFEELETSDPHTAKGGPTLYSSGELMELLSMSDVEEYIEGVTVESRLELFQVIKTRYCQRCGGSKGVSNFCGCNIGRRAA